MPIVLDPNSPELLATLATNAGLFAQSEMESDRARQVQLQADQQNEFHRQQMEQSFMQANAQQFMQQQQSRMGGGGGGQMQQQPQLPGGEGVLSNGARIFYPQGTQVPELEAQRAGGVARAEIDLLATAKAAAPTLARIQSMQRAGQLDEATAARWTGIAERGGNPFGEQTTAEQDKAHDRRAAVTAESRAYDESKVRFKAEQDREEKATQLLAQLKMAGDRNATSTTNTLLRGAKQAPGTAKADASQRRLNDKEGFTRGTKLHEERIESIDGQIKEIVDLVKAQAASDEEKALLSQLRTRRDAATKEYDGFLSESYAASKEAAAPAAEEAAGTAAESAEDEDPEQIGWESATSIMGEINDLEKQGTKLSANEKRQLFDAMLRDRGFNPDKGFRKSKPLKK
jgi:hypothetical protein